MPRNIRNFWIEAMPDGRDTPVRAGPARKDGGMNVTLYIRAEGRSVRAIDLICRAKASGINAVEVIFYDTYGKEIESKTLSVPR